jgi:hypothetical protein
MLLRLLNRRPVDWHGLRRQVCWLRCDRSNYPLTIFYRQLILIHEEPVIDHPKNSSQKGCHRQQQRNGVIGSGTEADNRQERHNAEKTQLGSLPYPTLARRRLLRSRGRVRRITIAREQIKDPIQSQPTARTEAYPIRSRMISTSWTIHCNLAYDHQSLKYPIS